MGGNGIALALSVASLLNTVFLFIFMKKMENIEVGQLVKGTLLYSLKMLIMSAIAALPCYFLHGQLVKFFAPYGRFIGYGAPIIVTGIAFAIIGVLELVISRDEIVSLILHKIKK